jgi:hypothetical protein
VLNVFRFQAKHKAKIPIPMPKIPVNEAPTRCPPFVGAAVVLEAAEDVDAVDAALDVDVDSETAVTDVTDGADEVDWLPGLVAVAVVEIVEAEAAVEAEADNVAEVTVPALVRVNEGSEPENPDAVCTGTETPPALHRAAY